MIEANFAHELLKQRWMQKDGNVLMKTKLWIKNEQAVTNVGWYRGNGGFLKEMERKEQQNYNNAADIQSVFQTS